MIGKRGGGENSQLDLKRQKSIKSQRLKQLRIKLSQLFFAAPTAAFSLWPNGRLAFVCWRALEENPLDFLPLAAASAHLPPQPAHDLDAPGPFAFANACRVRAILERAGFGKIEIAAHDELVGSGDLDTMIAVCSRVGALGKILRENPELRPATLPDRALSIN